MNATHAVDIQEIQTTRGEKALAVVTRDLPPRGNLRDPYAPPSVVARADQAAIDALSVAQSELAVARADLDAAFSEMEIRRERYRTALDARTTSSGATRGR